MSPEGHPFRLFERAIPESVCDVIVDLGNELPSRPAMTVGSDGRYRVAEEMRRTTVAFWMEEHWVTALATHYAMLANRKTWQFDLRLCQVAQFSTYIVGGFFGWHEDMLEKPFGPEVNPDWDGLTRRVSVSLNLSCPNSYDGGDLLFRDSQGNVAELPGLRAKGSVVVFPSSVVHCVTPVSRGVRKSLTAWILGPPVDDRRAFVS